MSSNELIKQKVSQLTWSYVLMVVGLLLLIINGVGIGLLLAATIFIYLPIFLKLYGMSGNVSSLGNVLNGLLSGLIIFGEMLSIFGVMAVIFGLLAGYLFGSLFFAIVLAVPLLISAFLYLRVSFGMKKGKEIWFSYAFLLIIFLGLGLLVVYKS
jgi:hypothetical protein